MAYAAAPPTKLYADGFDARDGDAAVGGDYRYEKRVWRRQDLELTS